MLKLASIIYGWVINWINQRYDTGSWPSVSFDLPVIVVGNLSAGGSGKTPHVAFLAKHFTRLGYSVGILSRGYGRRTKGIVFATDTSTAEQIGDEPLELFTMLRPWQVPIVACEDRVYGMPFLVGLLGPKPIVLMDDGFQHRKVKPSFSIILTPWHKPITQDKLLPLGRLREPVISLKRSQGLVITKCPEALSVADLHYLIGEIAQMSGVSLPYAATSPTMHLADATGAVIHASKELKTYLMTGIVHDGAIADWLKEKTTFVGRKRYKDHYAYSKADIQSSLKELPLGARLVVTGKDWVKIKPLLQLEERKTFLIVRLELTWKIDEGLVSALEAHVEGWYNTKN